MQAILCNRTMVQDSVYFHDYPFQLLGVFFYRNVLGGSMVGAVSGFEKEVGGQDRRSTVCVKMGGQHTMHAGVSPRTLYLCAVIGNPVYSTSIFMVLRDRSTQLYFLSAPLYLVYSEFSFIPSFKTRRIRKETPTTFFI